MTTLSIPPSLRCSPPRDLPHLHAGRLFFRTYCRAATVAQCLEPFLACETFFLFPLFGGFQIEIPFLDLAEQSVSLKLPLEILERFFYIIADYFNVQ